MKLPGTNFSSHDCSAHRQQGGVAVDPFVAVSADAVKTAKPRCRGSVIVKLGSEPLGVSVDARSDASFLRGILSIKDLSEAVGSCGIFDFPTHGAVLALPSPRFVPCNPFVDSLPLDL